METLIVLVFLLGYLAITLEHSLKVDKLIPSLLMMSIAWALISLGLDSFSQWFDSHSNQMIVGFSSFTHDVKLEIMENTLLHHFGKTCEILIFLVGAMTIVEIINYFDGFSTIKNFIKTKSKRNLLWIITVLAFALSSVIDNLTATIVLISILRKLIDDTQIRAWYSGFIIIAANAGGAWSPIGDVTTTMLWMTNKVTALKLIEFLILPSIICAVLPTLIASFLPVFKGDFKAVTNQNKVNPNGELMLYLGLFLIVLVPVFKTITHLPPYVGMMFSLSVFSVVAEYLSSRKITLTSIDESKEVNPHGLSPTFNALSKIEMPSILFFLGILMTVAALESLGMIFTFGGNVLASMDENIFIMLLGVGSAIIDNVPLVAASMGMFPMDAFPTDSGTWHFIAFAAGTGGSMLIIGSAAGVVAMGMEKISFFWYLKNISWLAMIGYLAGSLTHYLFQII